MCERKNRQSFEALGRSLKLWNRRSVSQSTRCSSSDSQLSNYCEFCRFLAPRRIMSCCDLQQATRLWVGGNQQWTVPDVCASALTIPRTLGDAGLSIDCSNYRMFSTGHAKVIIIFSQTCREEFHHQVATGDLQTAEKNTHICCDQATEPLTKKKKKNLMNRESHTITKWQSSCSVICSVMLTNNYSL